jgi:PAS domain S-box-containing protein
MQTNQDQHHLAKTLTEVALALTSKLSLEAVLDEILRQVQRLVPYQTAHIMLLEGKSLRIAYWQGYRAFGSEGLMTNLVQSLADFPLDAEVIISQQPIIIPDVQQEKRWVVQDETAWVRSNLMLPISAGDQVFGLLRLDADTPNAFSEDDVVLLEPLVNAAAIALENARLYDQAKQEIADRKRAEATLRRRNQELTLLTTAITQAAESIVITNGQGKIVYTNPAFEAMTGNAYTEVAGQHVILVLKVDRRPTSYYQNIWATVEAGLVWSGRMMIRRKDGRLFTADTTITPVRNENKSLANYVVVQRDISRELQLEELYHRAEKMDAIGRLTSGIVHDFNNLLTAISNYAETLQLRLPPNDSLQDVIYRIRHTVQRATNLSDQLMAFVRNEPVEPQVLDLNTIISDIGSMLGSIVGRQITVKLDLSRSLGLVKVDPTQIEQVIVNLAVNAGEAMPHGGDLFIRTARVVLQEMAQNHLGVEAGEYVLLSVSDTGAGMTDEVKAHIFEPFFTTKGEESGTGLGLATVFRIVEQSQGQILVDSEPGRGTTFRIYLPQVEAPIPAKPRRIRPSALPRGTETILVVEDEPAVRDLAARLLSRQGYTVLQAATGKQVFHQIQTYPDKIHLLLTDMVIPDLSGQALADRIKETHPNMKVLLMSGHRKKIFKNEGETDVIPFISKPFSAADFIVKVRTVLDS